MAHHFSISTTTELDVARVAIAGEIDLAAGPAVAGHMARLLTDEALTIIMVDLLNASFIDASGVGVLIAWKNRTEAAGKSMCVVGACGRVERVFTMAQVGDFLSGLAIRQLSGGIAVITRIPRPRSRSSTH